MIGPLRILRSKPVTRATNPMTMTVVVSATWLNRWVTEFHMGVRWSTRLQRHGSLVDAS